MHPAARCRAHALGQSLPVAVRVLGIDEPEGMSIFDLIAPRVLEEARRDVIPLLLDVGTWSGEAPLRGVQAHATMPARAGAIAV